MFKNLKFVSMAVSFVLLIQLNAFALSGDTSENQSYMESISDKEFQSELVSMTPSTSTVIPTATPSPSDDYGDTFSDAYSVKSDNKINGSICSYDDIDVFSFIATSKSCYIYAYSLTSNKITLYNKSHELIEKTKSFDSSPATYDSILQKVISYDQSSIIYDNLTIGDTYYLKAGGNTPATQYSITLHPYTDNHGDTYASAQIINTNTLVNGKIDYLMQNSSDIDVFAFIPETSGTYSFDSSFPIRTLSKIPTLLSSFIKLEKFDDNSKPIFLSPSIDESYRMNYDLINGEKYFLTIQINTKGDYSFTFNGPLSSPTPSPSPTISPSSTPRTGPKKGDINDDGNVNSVDFALLRMLLLGKITMTSDSFFEYRTDINGDRQIDSIDFAILRKYLLGIIDFL